MKRLIKNIILFFIAIILLSSVGLLGLIYTFIWSIFNFKNTKFYKYWSDFMYTLNVAIDKIGNILLGAFMNKFAVKELQYSFGNLNDTISYALAKNLGHLSPFGQSIVNILEYIDPGHMQNSLNKKI
jgi:hypothetical protein